MKLNTFVAEPMDVRVVVPYVRETELLQTVIDCLRIQFVKPELRRIEKKPDAYHRMLAEVWSEGREFFIVEQDVLAWNGGIARMSECPEAWCTMPLLCRGRVMYSTFGCVKFGQQLLDRFPDLWDGVGPEWFLQDSGFARELAHRIDLDDRPSPLGGEDGHQSHIHMPAAAHMNELHWPTTISNRWESKKAWRAQDSVGVQVVVTV